MKQLAAGSNHVLALTTKGEVLAWGAGQQSQLARRIIERNKLTSLQPQGVGLPKNKIEKVACGAYHSFAIAKDGSVYAWGLNNFAETGVPDDAGSDEAVVLRPTKVDALSEFKIVDIAGGVHHSLAATDDGKLVTWGRVDGGQVGVDMSILNEDNAIYDDHKRPRILIKPAVIPGKEAVPVATLSWSDAYAVSRRLCCHGRGWNGQQLRHRQGRPRLVLGLLGQLPDWPGNDRRHHDANRD